MKKRIYTPKEVAAMIGHDASTVNRWCKDGRIAARKPFGRWVITRGALLALLFSFGLLDGAELAEYDAFRRVESLRSRQGVEAEGRPSASRNRETADVSETSGKDACGRA